MFDHLVDLNAAEFMPEEYCSATELLDAKFKTVSLLDELGVKPDHLVATEAERSAAQTAFLTLTTGQDLDAQKLAVQTLNAPQAVKHLVGMLTAYDWQFVEQAQELRGYTVAKIVEETKHPDARIRLRALEMLGKVTEIALFTERVEIKRTEMSDAELDAKIKEKLGRVINAEYEKTTEHASQSTKS